MVLRVAELSSEQRHTLEGLIGRALDEGESLLVKPCRIVKPAPQGEERVRAAAQYLAHLDMLAQRAQNVPSAELEAAFEEACENARHGQE